MPQQRLLHRHRLCAAVALALGALLCDPMAHASTVSPLSAINGSNGFRLDGAASEDLSGHSVSAAGDINSDGQDALIVGAFRAVPNGNIISGSSYVLFLSPWRVGLCQWLRRQLSARAHCRYT